MVRAKFVISRKENWGNSGIVRMEPGRLSARKWNSWEHKAMKCRFYGEIPKLDVAGSTPVARSKLLLSSAHCNRIQRGFLQSVAKHD